MLEATTLRGSKDSLAKKPQTVFSVRKGRSEMSALRSWSSSCFPPTQDIKQGRHNAAENQLNAEKAQSTSGVLARHPHPCSGILLHVVNRFMADQHYARPPWPWRNRTKTRLLQNKVWTHNCEHFPSNKVTLPHLPHPGWSENCCCRSICNISLYPVTLLLQLGD